MLVTTTGILIVLGVALFIAWPLLRPSTAASARPAPSAAIAVGTAPELERERDRALAALREARIEHATGKLTDDDYSTICAELEGSALEAITALDTLSGAEQPSDETAAAAPGTGSAGFCGRCGAARVPEARFCSDCGEALPPRPQRRTD